MKILHLVKVHFDRRKPEIDSAWIERRLEFFRRYTLRSLDRQTFKNFGVWASCGVNMSASDVLLVGSQTGARAAVTRDDQHEPDSGLRRLANKCGVEYVYVTRVDSDDLYAPDALALANACRPKEPGRVEASMFRRGYMHDVRTGQTGAYCSPSTPFHTMMFPREVFCDEARYRAVDYGDHSQVGSRFPLTVLPDWRFAVLIHDGNFISDMTYARDHTSGVELSWSIDRFLDQPVTFDVDDFCDRWNCLPELDALKARYPDFRCTLFTIPARTSTGLMDEALKRSWVELAWHGSTHEPNEELRLLSPNALRAAVLHDGGAGTRFVRGFRPPGWYITPEHVEALNDLGMWVALHARDERKLGSLCRHGYYVCNARPYWHGHTSGEGQRAHAVCGNGIRECLPELLTMWPASRKFRFVSEAVGTIR